MTKQINVRRKKHCDRSLLNWRGKGSDVRFPEFEAQVNRTTCHYNYPKNNAYKSNVCEVADSKTRSLKYIDLLTSELTQITWKNPFCFASFSIQD